MAFGGSGRSLFIFARRTSDERNLASGLGGREKGGFTEDRYPRGIDLVANVFGSPSRIIELVGTFSGKIGTNRGDRDRWFSGARAGFHWYWGAFGAGWGTL